MHGSQNERRGNRWETMIHTLIFSRKVKLFIHHMPSKVDKYFSKPQLVNSSRKRSIKLENTKNSDTAFRIYDVYQFPKE